MYRRVRQNSKSSSESFGGRIRKDAIPDRSKSDYYCKICDSHMNNLQMWEAHVNGKRHIKNLNKKPGDPPSKAKFIKSETAVSHLQRKLERVEEPIVGLSFICETQRADPTFASTYTCYLCQSYCSNLDIVDHILTTKHRLAYLKEVDFAAHSMVEALRLSKENLDSLVYDRSVELERTKGRGRVEVKVEISKYGKLIPQQAFKRKGDDEYSGSGHTKKRAYLSAMEEELFTDSPFTQFMEYIDLYPTSVQLDILKTLANPEVMGKQKQKIILDLILYLTRILKCLPPHIMTDSLRERLRKLHLK